MVRLDSFLSVCILALHSLSWAHPGEDHSHVAAERAEYLRHNTRSLAQCAGKFKSQGTEAANLKRRQALAEELRTKRGLGSQPYLKARDLDSVLNKSHLSNQTGIDRETAAEDLFSDKSSCILQPDVTEGPFYVSGELIRKNITDGERGVPLALDIQIIDSTTCEPVPAIYLDIWHCNATGVYGGVVANGNGASSDMGNLNNTAFRGLQKTDNVGIAQFETIFPGHYAGRTNHIHVLTHNADAVTVHENNTLSGLVASHAGQIYFDQSLQAEVEVHEPYTANQQPLTLNTEDGVLAFEADIADPMVEYVLLGQDVRDGILGWISIGIDPSETRSVSAREKYFNPGGGSVQSEGGVQEEGRVRGEGGTPAQVSAAIPLRLEIALWMGLCFLAARRWL